VYRLILLGAGHVAWHLAPQLEAAGHRITHVFARNAENAKPLIKRLYNAQYTDKQDFRNEQADMVLLCLADKALPEILPKIQMPDQAILVHTSGSLDMNLLAPFAQKYGVFYPLQTFSKVRKVNWKEIPICLEASDEASLDLLTDLADGISQEIYQVSTADRQKLHLSAVFACNFSNHLWAIAHDILQKNDLDFALLKPLIRETLEKALEFPPQEVQTGPAIRKDTLVIDRQKEYLKNHHLDYLAVYEELTQSIQSLTRKKDQP
jgi:predicted short-subunit dehydrogenase-like oxidoreductase (DUF2520 family)